MKDLAERIVLALEDFGKCGSATTDDGAEIERLYYIYSLTWVFAKEPGAPKLILYIRS